VLLRVTPYQWRTQEFFSGDGVGGGGWFTPGIFFGGSTNSVEDREQRERGPGAVAPWSGVSLNLQMSETHIMIRLLWMYFPRNWEFG
jgi:hypothetical protein